MPITHISDGGFHFTEHSRQTWCVAEPGDIGCEGLLTVM